MAPPMSSLSLRLRRVLTLSPSTLLHHHHHHHKPLPSIPPPPLSPTPQNPNPNPTHNLPSQSIRSFKSSTTSLSSRARQPYNRDKEEDKFGPNDILFEGCDYNHWLITMDFPKDPKPTPEEMVETYVQTCAKVVGRSFFIFVYFLFKFLFVVWLLRKYREQLGIRGFMLICFVLGWCNCQRDYI